MRVRSVDLEASISSWCIISEKQRIEGEKSHGATCRRSDSKAHAAGRMGTFQVTRGRDTNTKAK